MTMLEHDATLPTRYVVERLMYRGRYAYGAKAVSYTYTAPQPDPRARPKVLDRVTAVEENCV